MRMRCLLAAILLALLSSCSIPDDGGDVAAVLEGGDPSQAVGGMLADVDIQSGQRLGTASFVTGAGRRSLEDRQLLVRLEGGDAQAVATAEAGGATAVATDQAGHVAAILSGALFIVDKASLVPGFSGAMPGVPLQQLAWLEGDVVVAGIETTEQRPRVARVTRAGDVVWSVALPAPTHESAIPVVGGLEVLGDRVGLAWSSTAGSLVQDSFFTLLAADGALLSQTRLNRSASSGDAWECFPRLAAGEGGFVVVTESRPFGCRMGGDSHIVARFAADGTPQGQALLAGSIVGFTSAWEVGDSLWLAG